jgi:hypothetical protein
MMDQSTRDLVIDLKIEARRRILAAERRDGRTIEARDLKRVAILMALSAATMEQLAAPRTEGR